MPAQASPGSPAAARMYSLLEYQQMQHIVRLYHAFFAALGAGSLSISEKLVLLETQRKRFHSTLGASAPKPTTHNPFIKGENYARHGH